MKKLALSGLVLALIFSASALAAIPEPYCRRNVASDNFFFPKPRCPQVYEPVCGFFDPMLPQCQLDPDSCYETYSNSCYACANPIVLYWLPGTCTEIFP